LLFFFTAAPHTDTYTLSLHDALPISSASGRSGKSFARSSPNCASRCTRFSATQVAERPLLSEAQVQIFPCASPRSMARSTSFERSEEHTSELQSQSNLVCRLLLEKKK